MEQWKVFVPRLFAAKKLYVDDTNGIINNVLKMYF